MKQCTWCKEIKQISEFTKNKREQDGYRRQCRNCSKTYEKKRYDTDRSIRALHATGQARRLLRNRLFICNYLSLNPCVDCGESDPIVLEFDHIQDDKEYNLSQLVAHGFAIKTIEKELIKCVVRCANCHRRKTSKQFNWYDKNGPTYNMTSENRLKALRMLEPIQPLRGSLKKNAKLNETDIPSIKQLISEGKTDNYIASKYKVSSRTIFNIRKGISWKHV